MKKLSIRLAMSALLTGFLFIESCKKDEEVAMTPEAAITADPIAARCNGNEDAAVLKPWYDLLNELIRTTPGHTPPIAAREIGYTGIALYEATTGGLNGYHTLAGQLNGLNSLPQRQPNLLYIGPVAANAALARIITLMVGNATPAGITSITTLEAANDAAFASIYNANDITRSRNFGHDIADAIYLYSQSDGGHQAYLANFPVSYVPPAGPGLWVPTPPANSPAMLPYWGNNRTFLIVNSSPLINPPAPPAYATNINSTLYKNALKVYTTVNTLTQAQKDIANFWADGGGTYTPPGHLVAIAVQMVRNKNFNLHKSAALLAREGICLNDAGIVCWRAKFAHNIERPITYIRDHIDNTWNSFIGTPPFPTYTSGHSSFSGGTARILSKQFGGNLAFNDSTKMALGFPARSFTSFTQAAQEAAVSRLYGGIHYQFDNINGYNCGLAVANNILLGITWN